MTTRFLSDLRVVADNVVIVLRIGQLEGLQSFTAVGTFVTLEQDRQGQVVTRPWLQHALLSHCLTNQVSSFLYVWPSFVICAVTFPVSSRKKKKKRTRTIASLPGGKQIGKRNRPLPRRLPPS